MNPPPNLTDQENRSIETYFGYSYQDKSIEDNTKRILTHILKHWNVNKEVTRPSAHAMAPAESVALKVYSIELKYYFLSFLIDSQSDSLYVEIFP